MSSTLTGHYKHRINDWHWRYEGNPPINYVEHCIHTIDIIFFYCIITPAELDKCFNSEMAHVIKRMQNFITFSTPYGFEQQKFLYSLNPILP